MSAAVLHLSRKLDVRPVVQPVTGVRLRNFEHDADVTRWLALREAAFADETPRVRTWGRDEFEASIQRTWWWRPDRMWLADTDDSTTVGAVIMALRGAGQSAKPAVHWLMVHPEWRNHGIGRLLITALEARAWDEGFREVRLETHAAWRSALAFYQRLGYQRV